MATSERRISRLTVFTRAIIAAQLASAIFGCSRETKTPVYGMVTVNGEHESIAGRVIFVPMDPSAAPVSHTRIENGSYRIDTRGGVPAGDYRVRVEAKRKTGRTVMVRVRGENVPTDEFELVGPEVYASAESPLIVTVPPESDGHIDLKVPID